MMEQENKCSYGCGQQARHLLKSSKWCCLPFYQSCPAVRERNIQSAKETYKNGRVSVFKQYGGWNKGLTKETDERVKKTGETFHKRLAEGIVIHSWQGKHLTDESKKNLSLKCGGYKPNSGRGKHGRYKGYWCDSSWELAWIIYQLDHGVSFQRNKQGFAYLYEGRIRKFYPDFRMDDGSYVEIKGWLDKKNKVKISSFCGVLKVLGGEEIKPYLEYASVKYGKNFISLYDDYIKSAKKVILCPTCGKEYVGWGKLCVICNAVNRRKVDRPEKEVLAELVRTIPMVRIGKMYGVSSTSVKKWCLSYGITKYG